MASLRSLFITLLTILHFLPSSTIASPVPLPFLQAPTLEAPHTRTFFYAGGTYVNDNSTNSSVLARKQYVEVLTPADGIQHPYPLLFIHGGGATGVQWLQKPDGGRGWASYFLSRGYQVLLTDLWSVGRSIDGESPPLRNTGPAWGAEMGYTAPERYGKYVQAKLHTQWPGTGIAGDPIFEEFFASLLPLGDLTKQQTISQAATCAALKRIGKPAILVTHSASGAIGWLATDACPELVKGHVAVEADQGPFTVYSVAASGAAPTPRRPYGISDVPITYDPPISSPEELRRTSEATPGVVEATDGVPSKFGCVEQVEPARQLPNVAKAPVLFLTGEASIHAAYDQCLVRYLQQAGVSVNFTRLEEVGLRGNGHFMMLEKNSGDIAEYVEGWLGNSGLV